jgi:hypothetical protein
VKVQHLPGWDSEVHPPQPEGQPGPATATSMASKLHPRLDHRAQRGDGADIVAIRNAQSYLFRKVGDPEGLPTILFDEIDTVFGPKAKENQEIRGLLNAGHRRGAVAGRCVVRGKLVETEEIPAYCAVAMAGLGGLPDTLLSRSVIVRMRRRAPNEPVQAYRRRVHSCEGWELRSKLENWCATIETAASNSWPDIPDGIEDRDADIWEPLLTVADMAGGAWSERPVSRLSRLSRILRRRAHLASASGYSPISAPSSVSKT